MLKLKTFFTFRSLLPKAMAQPRIFLDLLLPLALIFTPTTRRPTRWWIIYSPFTVARLCLSFILLYIKNYIT